MQYTDDIANAAKSLKSDLNTVARSAIVPRVDNFKEKVTKVNKTLGLEIPFFNSCQWLM